MTWTALLYLLTLIPVAAIIVALNAMRRCDRMYRIVYAQLSAISFDYDMNDDEYEEQDRRLAAAKVLVDRYAHLPFWKQAAWWIPVEDLLEGRR